VSGRRRELRRALAAAVAALPLAASAVEPPGGTVVSFVACPLYRDTDHGRKSGCWLADDPATGERYDVSQALAKPQLDREVLVEGVVAAQDHACGGIVLKPVRTSTLVTHCRGAMLPAEGYPGRAYVSPAQGPPTHGWEERDKPLPPPPYERRQITVQFHFGSDFLNYEYAEVLLETAARYARASGARTIRVTGYAATRPLWLSGHALSEPLTLARSRAEMVAEALRRLDVDPRRIVVSGRSIAANDAGTGPLAEASKRRVDISIEP